VIAYQHRCLSAYQYRTIGRAYATVLLLSVVVVSDVMYCG